MSPPAKDVILLCWSLVGLRTGPHPCRETPATAVHRAEGMHTCQPRN